MSHIENEILKEQLYIVILIIKVCKMSTNSHKSDDLTELGLVCDVILADWYNAGKDVFEIRQFRSEIEMHYRAAGKSVPAQIADPKKLVPTLRLLQATESFGCSADPECHAAVCCLLGVDDVVDLYAPLVETLH